MLHRHRKKYYKGPLKEALLPDPVSEVDKVNDPSMHVQPNPEAQPTLQVQDHSVVVKEQEPQQAPQAPQPALEEESHVEFVPLVKPVEIEHVNIPGYETMNGKTAPDIDVSLFTHPHRQPCVFMSGIDNLANSTIRVFLQKLGLQTFNAQSERTRGEFIIEQFQMHSHQFDFAVVILSADEILVQKIQTLEKGLFVTRQETIFELGFLVGKLGKSRVAVIYEEDPKYKRPTQYFDLLYTAFDDQGLWQKRLLNQFLSSNVIVETAIAHAS